MQPSLTVPTPGTREKILTSAEELVGELGFEAVSLRDITQAAGVNLAAVNYHFGSKDALMDEMITGIMTPMLQHRMDLLARVQSQASRRGENPDLERILDAYLRPMVQRVRNSPARGRLFFKLMGRCLSVRGTSLPPSVLPRLQESVNCMVNAISEVVPQLTREEIIWRLTFSVGALMSALIHGEMVARLTGEADQPEQEELLSRMTTFCAHGMRGPSTMKNSTTPT